jgi:hypothetical protein
MSAHASTAATPETIGLTSRGKIQTFLRPLATVR